MRLLFFLAVWKRPEITEICFMGISRLRNTGLFQTETLAVISEESMIPLCKKYNIDYCMHENKPLGRKKNYGLTQAFKKEWDYLVELGSDDVLKNEYLELLTKHIEGNHFLTIDHFSFLNSENGECRNYKTKSSYGLGRVISREALEKYAKGVEFRASVDMVTNHSSINKNEVGFITKSDALSLEKVSYGEIVGEEVYKIWNDSQETGLDNASMFFLHRRGVFGKQIKVDEPVGIDIKSKQNIWAYNPDIGVPADLETVLSGLSEDEKTAIKSLINGNRAN
jgi:hypothetical protein